MMLQTQTGHILREIHKAGQFLDELEILYSNSHKPEVENRRTSYHSAQLLDFPYLENEDEGIERKDTFTPTVNV